ncbi:SDR family NAD(P)-dependent oxidoreductase [Sphingomonas sp. LT1P40]|uniref:SDR family NAD(P)-dependent oxidoreductase n=1 Tax=Alteristakelama amylovorans TaxID=3096166 RepID=UPI002FC72B65
MKIDGMSAIVTGGASGLGAATASMLREQGAKVAIIDQDVERGEVFARSIGALFLQADVSDEVETNRAFDKIAREIGIARILVCCAGIAPNVATLREERPHPLDAFRRTVEVNLTGTFMCASRFAHRLRKLAVSDEDKGVIIPIASIAAFDGQPGQVAYAASKSALVGMTLPLARDLAVEHIRVVTIAPGIFDTPMLSTVPTLSRDLLGDQVPHPHRLGKPEEFAHMVGAVIRNPMINGETIRLDGALRLGPH